MLDDSVAQAEEIVHGVILLVCEIRHLERGLDLQWDPQQVEDLYQQLR